MDDHDSGGEGVEVPAPPAAVEAVESSEGFHDYTIPTAWERLVATIEACLHGWLAKDIPARQAALRAEGGGGPGASRPRALQARLAHRLPHRSDAYTLTLHLSPGEAPAPLADRPHKLQEWFGAGPCLVLAPNSYSGRVLDAQEANTLLSAAAAALTHQRLDWPLFLPVHDSLRDGQQGVAVAGGAVVQLQSDSLHASRLPEGPASAEGQLRLLQARLGGRCPAAAALCRAALADTADTPPAALAESLSGSSPGWAGGGVPGGGAAAPISMAVRCSYAVPHAAGAAANDSDEGSEEEAADWDRAAAWRPWAAHADPVGCLEADALWQHASPAAAVAADLRGLDPSAAAAWRLHALAAHHRRDSGHRGFVLAAVDVRRQFLTLQALPAARRGYAAEAFAPAPAALPGDSSCFGMLSTLGEATRSVLSAQDVGQLADEGWWLAQPGSHLPKAPPAWVLQDVLRDLFCAPVLPSWPGPGMFGFGGAAREEAAAGPEGPPAGKAAPLQALASRLALHALVLGNPRAIAMLWGRFLRELRFAHWEPRVALPRMPAAAAAAQQRELLGGGEGSSAAERLLPPPPDLRCGLLHQKLQLLDLCIAAAQNPTSSSAGNGAGGAELRLPVWEDEALADGPGSPPGSRSSSRSSSYHSMIESPGRLESPAAGAGAPSPPRQAAGGPSPGAPSAGASDPPQGVAGTLPGAFLLHHPGRPLNVPVTQEPPPCTEDQLAEREAAQLASACDRDGGAAARAALQGSGLLSDMAAFKAANPGCCLGDFVRWHSPRDWVLEEGGGGGGKGRLSERMAAPGNTWQLLWEAAAAAPVAAQRPLFSPLLEGERALHFLETLPPPALHAELLALGMSAAVNLLGQADAARLPSIAGQLARLREQVDATLQSGIALCPAGEWPNGGADSLAPGSSEEDEEPRQQRIGRSKPSLARMHSALHSLYSRGASLEAFTALVLRLGCAEQAVVAGQSLLQRLAPPPAPAQAADGAAEFAERAADALVAAALGERRAPGCPYGTTVACDSPQDRTCLAALMQQQQQQPAGSSGGGDSGSNAAEEEAEGSGGASDAAPAWPEPFQTEWLTQVASMASLRQQQRQGGGGGDAAAGGTAGGVWGGPGAWAHRLYVKALPAELRVATAISCDL